MSLIDQRPSWLAQALQWLDTLSPAGFIPIVGLISLAISWMLVRRYPAPIAWSAAVLTPLIVAEAIYWLIYLIERSDNSHLLDYTGWHMAFSLSAGLPCVLACLILVAVVTFRRHRSRSSLRVERR